MRITINANMPATLVALSITRIKFAAEEAIVHVEIAFVTKD